MSLLSDPTPAIRSRWSSAKTPLPDETMQLLAAEANCSETTFVSPVPADDGSYRVRIFTPAREIAFAGHPILGTAWVLRHLHSANSSARLQLNLSVGRIAVTLRGLFSRARGGLVRITDRGARADLPARADGCSARTLAR